MGGCRISPGRQPTSATRSRPAASALCLGGLVKHAARTERRWVVAGIAGQPLPGLWPIEDWPADCLLDAYEAG